jgi:DMSO/TMAO reductase YedYZ molybdopterin-dependent catalytic subunit
MDFLDRRKQEQKIKAEGRLPPGQSLTLKFPVLTASPNPPFDPATWDMRVFGEVERPVRWSWDEFIRLPTQTQTCDIHCVTRWSKFDTVWEGVSFRALAEIVGVKPSAQYVIAHCDYGYTTNLPLATMMDEEVMLAYRYDGQPLEADHGGPLRTLVPKRYFWKSAKFLRALEFSAVDKPGFWEVNGYHNEGDPWKEERYGRRGFF